MTSDLEADVQQLKHELRDQGNILKMMFFNQSGDLAASILERLLNDEVLRELYRGIDGLHTRQDVVERVKAMNLKGGSQSRAYSKFAELEQMGLIEPATSEVYRRSSVDLSLRLEVQPEFKKSIKGRPKVEW